MPGITPVRITFRFDAHQTHMLRGERERRGVRRGEMERGEVYMCKTNTQTQRERERERDRESRN